MVVRTMENLEISWDKKIDLEDLENLEISWDFFHFPTYIFYFHAIPNASLQTCSQSPSFPKVGNFQFQ